MSGYDISGLPIGRSFVNCRAGVKDPMELMTANIPQQPAGTLAAQIFATDVANFNRVNDVYKEFIEEPPTRSRIGLNLMSAGLLVEIGKLAMK